MEKISVYEIAKALQIEYDGPEVWVDDITTDSRSLTGHSLFVALAGERTDGHQYVATALRSGAALAAVEHPVPGLSPEEEARLLLVQSTFYVPLTLAMVYRDRFSPLVVGVTGSVGKTTTKDFIAGVVAKKYKTLKSQGNRNNEFGLPGTIFQLDGSYEAAVLEMGMDAKGDISRLTAVARPDIGVITNIGISHLERLGSRENILAAKLEMAEGMADGSPLILCGDNDLLATVKEPRLKLLRYGMEAPGLDARAENMVQEGFSTRFEIVAAQGRFAACIPAVGRHNVLNALAAFLVGQCIGLAPEKILEALAEYVPSGMRQRLRQWNGIAVVEDCYNAAPDSMHAALEVLEGMACSGSKFCVFADMLELGPDEVAAHLEVGRRAAGVADALLLYGPLSRYYAQGAQEAGLADAVVYASKEELIQALKSRVDAGDIVWFKGSRSMRLEEVLQAAFPE